MAKKRIAQMLKLAAKYQTETTLFKDTYWNQLHFNKHIDETMNWTKLTGKTRTAM